MATILKSFPTVASAPGGPHIGTIAYGVEASAIPGFINPATTEVSFAAGQLVKLVSSSAQEGYPVVDVITAADLTAGAFQYYVIVYDQKVSAFVGGDPVSLLPLNKGAAIYMKAAVAINANDKLYWSITAKAVTSTVAANVTTPQIGFAQNHVVAGGAINASLKLS